MKEVSCDKCWKASVYCSDHAVGGHFHKLCPTCLFEVTKLGVVVTHAQLIAHRALRVLNQATFPTIASLCRALIRHDRILRGENHDA